jgi:hypothetical protein
MTQPHIFKSGELAFSLCDGFQKITKGEFYLIHGFYRYTSTGFLSGMNKAQKHPSLFTVEQAAKLGYFPEPDNPKPREFWMIKHSRGIHYDNFDIEQVAREYHQNHKGSRLFYVREVLDEPQEDK